MAETDGTPRHQRARTVVPASAIRDISAALNAILADGSALHMKTRSFQWHMAGAHCRDYQHLLGEQATQLRILIDRLASRVRRIGGSALRSIGHIARLQRIIDNDSDAHSPVAMLAELRDDNRHFARSIYAAHQLCEEHGDLASAGQLNLWIDEAEGRVLQLLQTAGAAEVTG